MKIGIPKESCPTEARVALIPAQVKPLVTAGHTVSIETGAGLAAGYLDTAYADAGAELMDRRESIFQQSDILFMVRGPGANPEAGQADLQALRVGQSLIGFLEPLSALEASQSLAVSGASAFAMELIPRITKAQNMDALSSMASLAGYKAVLLAANTLVRIFPMMITAAGSLSPAKVFVIGAGVAGLQACATAKRLGARVSAYDLRPVVKEQVESVGARFVEFDLGSEDEEDAGGYAKAQSDDFYARQQAEMAKTVVQNDVVITTAAVPGKKAPTLITEDMVRQMEPGSVIVDVAAERGGNCALTVPGKTVTKHDVTIVGHANLPSLLAYHASQMLGKNISNLFFHLTDADGNLVMDMDDPITRGTLLCRDSKLVHDQVRELADQAAAQVPKTTE